MPDLIVYEKASCSTVRKLHQLLADQGVDVQRVDFHVQGWDEGELREILRKAGLGPRDVLRTREPLVSTLGLPGDRSDDELLALMVAHPELVQRPIVVRGDRAVLARPVERVLELL